MINQQLSRFATHENSAYPQLWRGCVGAWCPSLGPSGSRLHDYSRRQNWGTLTNMDPATDWVVDGGGYALDFDGSNDNVLCGAAGISGNAAVAMSFWMLRRSASANAILGFGESGSIALSSFGAFVNSVGAGVISIEAAGGNTVSNASAVVPADTWTHVVIQKTPGALNATSSIAVNGVVYAATTGSANTPSFINTAFYLGQWGTFAGFFFDGQLDDTRVYNRVLSLGEIRLLASRRGIAFTLRTRRIGVPEQAAATTNRRRRIICGSQC